MFHTWSASLVYIFHLCFNDMSPSYLACHKECYAKALVFSFLYITYCVHVWPCVSELLVFFLKRTTIYWNYEVSSSLTWTSHNFGSALRGACFCMRSVSWLVSLTRAVAITNTQYVRPRYQSWGRSWIELGKELALKPWFNLNQNMHICMWKCVYKAFWILFFTFNFKKKRTNKPINNWMMHRRFGDVRVRHMVKHAHGQMQRRFTQ